MSTVTVLRGKRNGPLALFTHVREYGDKYLKDGRTPKLLRIVSVPSICKHGELYGSVTTAT